MEGDRQALEVSEQAPPQLQHHAPAQLPDARDVGARSNGLHCHRDGKGNDDQRQWPGVVCPRQARDLVDPDADQPGSG